VSAGALREGLLTETTVRPPSLPAVRGQLMWPTDPDYAEARRVFNGMFDRRPSVIVCCVDTRDVVQALAYARETRSEVTVYGGGHGVTGSATFVADVVEVDAPRGPAVAGEAEERSGSQPEHPASLIRR